MKLAEIIEKYVSGDWGSDELSTNTPNAVACIRGADFVPILSVDYSDIPTRYISDNSYENKRLKEGDIIIEKSGGSPTQSTGRVIIVTKDLLRDKCDIVCSNFCEAFRVKKGWNPFYVLSYLQFLYSQGVFFNFEGKTSGLKNLQMEQAFNSIDIPQQKSDISILTTIDEIISLNRKANRQLEILARQIYNYWFVQFDFPNEEGKPYKSSGGKMVWNEKLGREIPDGWSNDSLDKLLNIEDNKRIPLSSQERAKKQGIYPYYGATGIMDYIDDYIFDGDYLLLAEDGSTSDKEGHPVVQYIWGKTWVNNHAHIIIPKDERHLIYYYFLLKTIPAIKIESGSIQKKISQKNLLSYSVLCPPKSIINAFCNILLSNIEKQKILTDEINAQSSLRNFILPLLMTGQVTIKD